MKHKLSKYEQELQDLKPWDKVEYTTEIGLGYKKIITTGHGYMVIPKDDLFYDKALAICKYGFKGDLACYLEEDCEISNFKALYK